MKEEKKRGGAREGAGRPSLYTDKKRVQVMLTESNVTRLNGYAEKHCVSKSDCLNYILDHFFTNVD